MEPSQFDIKLHQNTARVPHHLLDYTTAMYCNILLLIVSNAANNYIAVYLCIGDDSVG